MLATYLLGSAYGIATSDFLPKLEATPMADREAPLTAGLRNDLE
jgi:hypothetical protein